MVFFGPKGVFSLAFLISNIIVGFEMVKVMHAVTNNLEGLAFCVWGWELEQL